MLRMARSGRRGLTRHGFSPPSAIMARKPLRNPAKSAPRAERRGRPRAGKGAAPPDERLALADASAVTAPATSPVAQWLVLPMLVALAALVTFSPALDAEFVNWDDDKTIVDNPRIRGFDWSWAFTQSKMGHYHPLTWLSYSVDHAIGQARYEGLPSEAQERYRANLDPRIFHLTNLLLHAGVGVAFYFLARLLLRIFFPRGDGASSLPTALAACVAALLFACHPLRVENAVWVTERRDVLSGIFLLPCLHCYLRYALTEQPGRKRILFYLGTIVLLVLSLLSKAWGITMPAVMLLLDFHPLRRFGRDAGWLSPRAWRAYLDKLPMIAIAAYFAYQAKLAQAVQLATMKTLDEWSITSRILQAFYGLVFYTWKTFIPTRLTPLVPLPVEATRPAFEAQAYFSMGIVIVVAIVLLLLRKRWPAGIVAVLIYAGVLSPILGIAQSGPQLVADKYAYLACLVWPLLLASGLMWIWRRGRGDRARLHPHAFTGALVWSVVLAAVYASLAFEQTRIWQNSYSLWSHAVEMDGNCVLARSNLGMLERQKGNVAKAIEHYEAAFKLNPRDAILLNNYAYALRQDPARLGEAIEILRQAVALRPKFPDLRFTLGNALKDAGEVDAAIVEFNRCLQLHRKQPRPKYHRALGTIYLERRELDKAKHHYEQALALELRLDPRGKGVINAHDRLGRIMLFRENPDAAIGHFRAILEIDPNNNPAKRGIQAAERLRG
jgi:Tfp pilus assembly protein PilF